MTTGLRDRFASNRSRHERRAPGGRWAVVDELRDLAKSDDFVGTLLRSAQLADHVGRSPQSVELIHQLDDFARESPFGGVLAIEVLGAIDHGAAVESLTALLAAPDPLLRRHAAWRLRRRPVSAAAVPSLLDMVVVGGPDTMHSHRTLRRWAASDPAIVGRAANAPV